MPVNKLTVYTVTPVWLLVTLAGFLVLGLAPSGEQLLWLSVALAASIILTFCIQLGLDRKEGLVNRVMASVSGSVVIAAVMTLVSVLMR